MDRYLQTKVLILILLAVLASACNNSGGDSNLNGTENRQGSPYPFLATSEEPSFPQDFELHIPTPSQNGGVVTGKLVHMSSDSEPYIADLYLGLAIPADQPDFDPIISFSQETDAKAIQNPSSGEFVFPNISPGIYALVIWTPINSNVIREPGGEKFMLIEVVTGETLNLGTIFIP